MLQRFDVGDFAIVEIAIRAARKSAEANRADRDAFEECHLFADRGEHTANLAVFALRDDDLQLADAVLELDQFDLAARRLDAVVEHHALAKLREFVLGHLAVDVDEIGLFHFVAGVSQSVDRVAVVGQKKQSLGVVIQPADGHEMRYFEIFEIVVNGLAPLFVTARSHAALGLVEHDVFELGDGADDLAVHRDDVAVPDRGAEGGDEFVVDLDSAVRDQ